MYCFRRGSNNDELPATHTVILSTLEKDDNNLEETPEEERLMTIPWLVSENENKHKTYDNESTDKTVTKLIWNGVSTF